MKWVPERWRRVIRRRRISGAVCRKRKAAEGCFERRISRWLFFNAEQAMNVGVGSSACSATRSASFESQPKRSVSSSGIPDAIFARFEGGWKSSPSKNLPSVACARALPSVVFPEAATPMRMKVV